MSRADVTAQDTLYVHGNSGKAGWKLARIFGKMQVHSSLQCRENASHAEYGRVLDPETCHAQGQRTLCPLLIGHCRLAKHIIPCTWYNPRCLCHWYLEGRCVNRSEKTHEPARIEAEAEENVLDMRVPTLDITWHASSRR